MLCDKNLTYKFGKEQRYIFCNLCVELTCFLFSENEKMLLLLLWHICTVGVKSMSPVDIELLLFVILYNITALHHNRNLFFFRNQII